MSPQPLVRDMHEADATAVSRLLAECYRFLDEQDGLTGSQLAALLETRASPEHVLWLRSRYSCFVTELDSTLAGVVAFGAGSVEALFVLPGFHRRGVGTALFEHSARRLLESGYERLTVTTTGYGRPFYEAMGMTVAGTCPVSQGPLVGRELVVLVKELNQTL